MSYKINKYPDGTSYVTIPKEWEDTYQEIVFRVNSYEDVIYLTQLCDVLIHNRVKAHITIPCLLDAQADRRFGEYQSSGLTVLARVLEPYINGYNLSLEIFHPHNPEVVEALFTGVVITDNTAFIRQVIANLAFSSYKEDPNNKFIKNTILMSSDAGGFKPLMKLCDKLDWRGGTYSASKYRYPGSVINGGSKLAQTVGKEDFKGKDILIVDDISVYGGTFKGLSKLLRERNVGKLYLAVSHMTVQNLGDDPVTNYFDKVFTTNSKFNKYLVTNDTCNYGSASQPKNLEIIELWENQQEH